MHGMAFHNKKTAPVAGRFFVYKKFFPVLPGETLKNWSLHHKDA